MHFTRALGGCGRGCGGGGASGSSLPGRRQCCAGALPPTPAAVLERGSIVIGAALNSCCVCCAALPPRIQPARRSMCHGEGLVDRLRCVRASLLTARCLLFTLQRCSASRRQGTACTTWWSRQRALTCCSGSFKLTPSGESPCRRSRGSVHCILNFNMFALAGHAESFTKGGTPAREPKQRIRVAIVPLAEMVRWCL